jgi:4-diphosphocytidyl-2-C-methyl-D-erythritol kinase
LSGTRVVEAPAKVNLRLRVLGRRPDGYHDIETLFQAISLADEVEVRLEGEGGAAGARVAPAARRAATANGRRLSDGGEEDVDEGAAAERVTLEVVGAELGPGHENLAHRAAEAFLGVTGRPGRVHVRLVKRIPAGAGLGGGSSDAAAVLRCLDDLSGGVDPETLRAIAEGLGSDVPFFLGPSPLAAGRGRGERLDPLPPLPEAHLVLALPPVQVSTAWAYRALADARAGPSAPSARQPVALVDAASSWAGVTAHAENDFEPVVAPQHPEVRRSLEGLRGEGARWALLSGSGAASFGVFDTAALATSAAHRLGKVTGWRFVVASTLTEMPVPRVPAGDDV